MVEQSSRWRLRGALTALLLVAVAASADVRVQRFAYSVLDRTTGRTSSAVLIYGDTGCVIGTPDGETKPMRIAIPVFTRLTVGEESAVFEFPNAARGSGRLLVLRDLVVEDGLLFADPAVCERPVDLVLELAPDGDTECREVEVPEEERVGDWDPCVFGYGSAVAERCQGILGSWEMRIERRGQAATHWTAVTGEPFSWADPVSYMPYCATVVDVACWEHQAPVGGQALAWAVERGAGSVLAALVATGLDPTEEGLVDLAVSSDHPELIAPLVAAGAPVDDPGPWSFTPLLSAALSGRLEAVRALLAVGADVGSRSESGDTALILAAQGGHLEAVEAMLTAGARVDDTSVEGITALHAAVQNGHRAVVEELLAAGADPNVVSHTGFTVLDVCGDPGIEALLIGHGARR